MTAARVRRHQPPIQYRDRQDRVVRVGTRRAHVRRLQITMDGAGSVRAREAARNLRRDVQRLRHRGWAPVR